VSQAALVQKVINNSTLQMFSLGELASVSAISENTQSEKHMVVILLRVPDFALLLSGCATSPNNDKCNNHSLLFHSLIY